MEYNAFDLSILQALHIDYATPLLQKLMVFVSSEVFSLSVSLVVILYMFKKAPAVRWQRIIGLFAAVGATDAFCAYVLKPFFGRLRPCQVFEEIDAIAGCAGLYSFPSNHAANTMSFATFIFFAVNKRVGKALFYVALIVGVSRVVLGVHYPTDIIFGYCVGFSIAYFFTRLVEKTSARSNPDLTALR